MKYPKLLSLPLVALAFVTVMGWTAHAQNNNPDLSGVTFTAKAIVTYRTGAATVVQNMAKIGWGSDVEWRFEVVNGEDRWVWPAKSLATCQGIVTPNPDSNVYTSAQRAVDSMLAATSGTTDPDNAYTARCEDGWP